MPASYPFLRHIDHCTNHDPNRFVPLHIGEQTPGLVRRDAAPFLDNFDGFSYDGEALTLQPTPDIIEKRSLSIEKAALFLSKQHGVPLTNEIYPIIEKWGDAPLAEIDRAAIPWFGTRGFGVHANGFVRKANGLHIWVARRAAGRHIDPGKLDNLVGGGLPIGLTILENLIKEAWEEAGIPQQLAQTGQYMGSLSYKIDMMKGVRNDTLFIFDLELPESFTPENTDGEVESFTLMPAIEAARLVGGTDEFKFNCNLVMIDFFLRHDIIGTDHPEYQKLQEAMAPIRGN